MVCAASPEKKKEAKNTIKEKKGPMNKVRLGLTSFAKGLKTMGKKVQ